MPIEDSKKPTTSEALARIWDTANQRREIPRESSAPRITVVDDNLEHMIAVCDILTHYPEIAIRDVTTLLQAGDVMPELANIAYIRSVLHRLAKLELASARWTGTGNKYALTPAGVEWLKEAERNQKAREAL